jgi:hypothetical protein
MTVRGAPLHQASANLSPKKPQPPAEGQVHPTASRRLPRDPNINTKDIGFTPKVMRRTILEKHIPRSEPNDPQLLIPTSQHSDKTKIRLV